MIYIDLFVFDLLATEPTQHWLTRLFMFGSELSDVFCFGVSIGVVSS